MSLTLPFYIADVFEGSKYTGSQIGVFRIARSLADDEMQSITKDTRRLVARLSTWSDSGRREPVVVL